VVTAVDSALAALKRGGSPNALYAAVKDLPEPAERELSEIEDGDPVNSEWDKVYDAWVRGELSDAVFKHATAVRRRE
jgi:hypothetical protein